MSHRFLITLKKWPLAVRKALSLLNEISPDGETCSIGFQFGPPSQGRLPFQMRVDGKRVLLCELSDCNLSFLHEMRGWMERCLLRDREGTLHPELLTLDGVGTVLSLVAVHVGWEEGRSRAEPVSLLVVIRSDRDEPLYCFCRTLEMVCNLYGALVLCLERYGPLFNDPGCWYDIRRLDQLDPRSTKERLLEMVRSPRIESICRMAQKKYRIDDDCQSGGLHLSSKTTAK